MCIRDSNKMPGFHTPDMPINHLSELFLLEDINAEDLRQLLPHVCLIPSQENKINLNTANTLTLASLDNGIGLANAEVVVSDTRTSRCMRIEPRHQTTQAG